MMFNLSPIFMQWSVPLSFKTDGSTVSLGGVHFFRHSFKCNYAITSVIAMFQRITPRWRYEDVLQEQRCFQLLMEFTRSWNIFEQYCPRCDLNVFVHWLSFFEPHCPPFTDFSFNHLSLPPSWFEYCLFFFLRSIVLPHGVSTFQGILRRVDVISCQGFRRLNQCSSLFDNLSCSGIKSHTSPVMYIQV
jgi:hypothetical protein